jgi:hypothetical protein
MFSVMVLVISLCFDMTFLELKVSFWVPFHEKWGCWEPFTLYSWKQFQKWLWAARWAFLSDFGWALHNHFP